MHGLLHRRMREPWAAAVFGGMLMSATLTLPAAGRTPPPWRWPAGMIATSVDTHAAYVTAVAVVDDAVRRGR